MRNIITDDYMILDIQKNELKDYILELYKSEIPFKTVKYNDDMLLCMDSKYKYSYNIGPSLFRAELLTFDEYLIRHRMHDRKCRELLNFLMNRCEMVIKAYDIKIELNKKNLLNEEEIKSFKSLGYQAMFAKFINDEICDHLK